MRRFTIWLLLVVLGGYCADRDLAGQYAGEWKSDSSGNGGATRLTLDALPDGTWKCDASFTLDGAEVKTVTHSIKLLDSKLDLSYDFELQGTNLRSHITGEWNGACSKGATKVAWSTAPASMRARGVPAARSKRYGTLPGRSGGTRRIGYTYAMLQRKEAVLRGLQFIYRNSLEGDNFEDWGGDYLWCFHCVASTSADAELRAVAREMGTSLARRWQGEQRALPELADADEVGYYMSMLDVSSRLGIDNHELRAHVYQGSCRYTAREYLGFDPVREAPPTGKRSRYDIWCDALVLTYTGDGCGIPMGASYVDVLRWLPQMRPYCAEGAEFRDMVLAITHLVYTLNDYNRYRLSPEWLPQEFEFLRENLNRPVDAGDAELLGEFVDCLRAFGLAESDAVVSSGVEYLLASQNADGSWGGVHEPDVHKRYHTAWTAIDGLRDYAWSERTKWPAGVREVLLGIG